MGKKYVFMLSLQTDGRTEVEQYAPIFRYGGIKSSKEHWMPKPKLGCNCIIFNENSDMEKGHDCQ